ncbi:LemA family protein [Campylobacter rectus]|uniref:LemA family protein n=1 Tax=Campylobacter rectus TaxID=203 RepID=UPI0023F36AA1|nr:LemA family protein [Campylobacter rectus]
MKNLMIFLVFIGIIGGVAMKYVNAFPVLDETVKEKWAQVQNQYKRRADLIPNLVKTVQGYASHEEGVFKEVTEARSKATQMTLDVSALDDPAKLKEFEAAQKTLGGALSRLMAITENYPQLKADQNFLALQSQLEGTENRIAVARKDYIEAVRDYNVALRKIPGKFIAEMLYPELKPRATFEASEAEQSAPDVSFAK